MSVRDGDGTWAGSGCGVSCTGWGEYFIRNAVAHDVAARVAYLQVGVQAADRGQDIGGDRTDTAREARRETHLLGDPSQLGLVAKDQLLGRAWPLLVGQRLDRIDQRQRVPVLLDRTGGERTVTGPATFSRLMKSRA